MHAHQKEVVKDVVSAAHLESELAISQAQHGVTVLDVYNAEWGSCKALGETFRRLFTDAGDTIHLRFYSVECGSVLDSLHNPNEPKPTLPVKGMTYAPDTRPERWTSMLESRRAHSKPFFAFYKEGRMRSTVEGIDTPRICRVVQELCRPQDPASNFLTNPDAVRFWEAHFSITESEIPAKDFAEALVAEAEANELRPLLREDTDAIVGAIGVNEEGDVTAAALQAWVGETESVPDKIAACSAAAAAAAAAPASEEGGAAAEPAVEAGEAGDAPAEEDAAAAPEAEAGEGGEGDGAEPQPEGEAAGEGGEYPTEEPKAEEGAEGGEGEGEAAPAAAAEGAPADASAESPAEPAEAEHPTDDAAPAAEEGETAAPAEATEAAAAEEGEAPPAEDAPAPAPEEGATAEEEQQPQSEHPAEEPAAPAAEGEEQAAAEPVAEAPAEGEETAAEHPTEEAAAPEEAAAAAEEPAADAETHATEEEPQQEEEANAEPAAAEGEAAPKEEEAAAAEEAAPAATEAEEEQAQPQEEEASAEPAVAEGEAAPKEEEAAAAEEAAPAATEAEEEQAEQQQEGEAEPATAEDSAPAAEEDAAAAAAEPAPAEAAPAAEEASQEGGGVHQIFTDRWVTVTEDEMRVWNLVAALPLHYPSAAAPLLQLSHPDMVEHAAELVPSPADSCPTLATYLKENGVSDGDVNMMCLAAEQKVGSESMSYGKLALILISSDAEGTTGLLPMPADLSRHLSSGTLVQVYPALAFTALCLCASEAYPEENFFYVPPASAAPLEVEEGTELTLSALAPLHASTPAASDSRHYRLIGLPKVIELATTDECEDTVVLNQWSVSLRVTAVSETEVTLQFVEVLCGDAFNAFAESYTARLVEDESRLDKKTGGSSEGAPADAAAADPAEL